MLFLHFLFQKVCILYVCIRKNLCIQLLRAYAKVLFYLFLSLCMGRLYVCFTVQAVRVSAVQEPAERPEQEPAVHPVPAAG